MLPGKEILIIDDDLLNQKVLSRILKSSGFNVTVAQDGLIALEIIQNNKFDLIISDINMPNLNGIQFLEKLNARKLVIPIIFLSGESVSATKDKVLNLGAADYLVKPVDRDVLLNSISKL